jgi:putative nucleotidyltransferase with HDIG domain
MTWTVGTSISISAVIIYAGLYFIVSLSKPSTITRRAFKWYILAMVLWSVSAFLVLANTAYTAFWFRFMTASALWSIINNFHFVNRFAKTQVTWAKFVTFYGVLTTILTVFTDLVIVSAAIESGFVVYEFGKFLPVLGLTYLLLVYIIYILLREYHQTEDNSHKNRIRYILFGSILIILGTIINFTPLGKYPYDIAANGVAALLIAYAILRHQLLDIRVFIRQGLLYSIPTILIGTLYFLFISLLIAIFGILTNVQIFILSLAVAIITALVAEPLRERAQSTIDRMFFREKYDSSLMIQSMSSRVASVLDLYKITNMILEEVSTTLHITKAAFFLRDEVSGRFQLTSNIGYEKAQNIEFRQSHPIILWLSAQIVPLTRHEIDLLPQFQSMWKSEWQDLDDLEAELFIPIQVQNELVGLFILGLKRSEQAYNSEDILTLSTIANQSAVAIENARLYTSEQIRLKEMDTLYSMARRLVATDNLDDVMVTVARHAAESVGSSHARILTREENGDYICRAVYPQGSLASACRIGGKEPLVAEHYYSWIFQQGEAVVVHRDDYSLHEEEKSVLFFDGAQAVCLSPLKGADEHVGLLILGDDQSGKDAFPNTKIRLINVISDYATSAIQRAMLHDRLQESFLQTVVSLANAMDARDSYTGDHSQRMAAMAKRVGQAMKLPAEEVEILHWAAILHDIGKIGVPDGILNKKGSLTKKEWVVMREHPVIGAQIVEPVKYLSAVSPIIRAHHEKFDGTGYPYGLEGEEIPLGSRILSVVDAYVAIRDERIYSKSHSHEEAVAELRRFSGTQFDPDIVDIFCKTITV